MRVQDAALPTTRSTHVHSAEMADATCLCERVRAYRIHVERYYMKDTDLVAAGF